MVQMILCGVVWVVALPMEGIICAARTQLSTGTVENGRADAERSEIDSRNNAQVLPRCLQDRCETKKSKHRSCLTGRATEIYLNSQLTECNSLRHHGDIRRGRILTVSDLNVIRLVTRH